LQDYRTELISLPAPQHSVDALVAGANPESLGAVPSWIHFTRSPRHSYARYSNLKTMERVAGVLIHERGRIITATLGRLAHCSKLAGTGPDSIAEATGVIHRLRRLHGDSLGTLLNNAKSPSMFIVFSL